MRPLPSRPFAASALPLVAAAALQLAGCAANLALPESSAATANLPSPATTASNTPVKAGAAIETGTLPPAAAALVASAAAAAGNVPSTNGEIVAKPDVVPATSVPEELYIDFEPASVTLSDKEKASLREAVTAKLLATGKQTKIKISAARGGTGNLFDQATFATKRARSVKEVLPPRVVETIEFDPSLPEDTVRLEFRKS